MKKTLQVLAVLVAIGTAATWAALGANRAWTKTQVQMKTVDEVTGIEQVTWQNKFLPGVDFLGAGLVGAGALAGASLIFRKQPNTKPNN